jgi:hypothetical protein
MFTWGALLPIVVLTCAFIGVVLWFDQVDFYHLHFFDPGAIVVADNLVRIFFVAILSWLIYVPGAWIAGLIMSPTERAALSPAERAVTCFCIGIGICHVALLLIGILDLYFRLVMTALCAVVLAASAMHFADVTVATWRGLSIPFAELRRYRPSTQAIGTAGEYEHRDNLIDDLIKDVF